MPCGGKTGRKVCIYIKLINLEILTDNKVEYARITYSHVSVITCFNFNDQNGPITARLVITKRKIYLIVLMILADVKIKDTCYNKISTYNTYMITTNNETN